MKDILSEIIAHKRIEIEQQNKQSPSVNCKSKLLP